MKKIAFRQRELILGFQEKNYGRVTFARPPTTLSQVSSAYQVYKVHCEGIQSVWLTFAAKF